jgi:putative flippase GtrA
MRVVAALLAAFALGIVGLALGAFLGWALIGVLLGWTGTVSLAFAYLIGALLGFVVGAGYGFRLVWRRRDGARA